MKYCLVPAPPALEHQRVFHQVEQSRHSTLSSGRHNPRRSVIPQGRPVHPGPLFHTLTKLPLTCGEICLQVLDQMVAKKHFLFSTDCYHPQSTKTLDRMRRSNSEKVILAGPATRKPYDCKKFRANDDNKKQLWCTVCSTGSFKAGENRYGSADRRRESQPIISSH